MESNYSYAEYFQNLKWLGMIALSIMISVKENDKKFYSWTILFLFLFLEDIFRIHQVITSFISQNIIGGISTRNWKILEIFVASIIGTVVIAPLIRNYRKGDAQFNQKSKRIIALLLLLVFFGVVMDQAHRLHLISSNWKREFIVGIIEDGGEMLTASCLLGYLFISYLKRNKKIIST